jgi:hypothetical protein
MAASKTLQFISERAVYGDIFDGLRSYYEQREGIKSSPAFSAAMALSFIASLNLASAVILIDYLAGDRAWLGARLMENKLLVLGVGGVMAAVHVIGAKHTGLYTRLGPARRPAWKTMFLVYVSASAVTLLTVMTVALA